MVNNKVVKFHYDILKSLSLRVANAEQEYCECCKANIRFFMEWGYFNEDNKEKEMLLYLKFVDLYGKYLLQEERYYRVKGVTLCQEESR